MLKSKKDQNINTRAKWQVAIDIRSYGHLRHKHQNKVVYIT